MALISLLLTLMFGLGIGYIAGRYSAKRLSDRAGREKASSGRTPRKTAG